MVNVLAVNYNQNFHLDNDDIKLVIGYYIIIGKYLMGKTRQDHGLWA